MTQIKEFKKPYLVQRLNAPKSDKLDNLFAFGGGLKNGGLSADAMALFRDVFSFDYMGSSEFEWGAVPEAFQVLAGKKLATGVLSAPKKPVYYLCPEEYAQDVERWIADEVASKNGHTKERVRLIAAINEEQYCRTVGWLALERYPFMCFIDKKMRDSTCKIFGIDTVTQNEPK